MTGTAPTLRTMAEMYGVEFTEGWIVGQIEFINLLFGSDKKMSAESIYATAQAIFSQYNFLKCTEIMLYLDQLKAGRYGKVYGGLDGMMITNALFEYCKGRDKRIKEYMTADYNAINNVKSAYKDWADLNSPAQWNEQLNRYTYDPKIELTPENWVNSDEFKKRFDALTPERRASIKDAIKLCFHVDIN